ncbi:OmpA family protein [Larkinella insperata]|uniref:OmpA family protein n=1 Tax=Larkinella insperata TaxID=332158 RepID=A0ABW3QE85_9BACT|nr:OmpA family protein [Larkinella insperata]
MVKVLLALLFIQTLAQAQFTELPACLHIEGKIVDYVTNSPLANAKLYVKSPTNRVKVAQSDATGWFEGEISCTANELIIEKAGYRSQNMHLRQKGESDLTTIAVFIPLLAVERQGKDKPYLQTEQTDYVHRNTASSAEKISKGAGQHSIFMIKDAVLNSPIEARVCFFFTKESYMDCKESDSNGQVEYDFKEADIVALEVSAVGYQTFAGNLIVDAIDGRVLKHKIQLQRELTVLTVQTTATSQCKLRADNKEITLSKIPGKPGWFCTYKVRPQLYELVITDQSRTTRQSITLNNGLNYVQLSKKKVETSTSLLSTVDNTNYSIHSSIAPLFSPDSIPMIYFQQGSYLLRSDSQEVLKQVAIYLKAHPNFALQVTGHTDNVGEERKNKVLSDYRAVVAANFLIQQGISESRLNKTGVGSKQPISPNDTEANKALNRRVSLKIINNL